MSEQYLQTLINAMSENVAIVDETGIILQVNDSWETFSELNRGTTEATSKSANYFTAVEQAAENYDEFAVKAQTGIQQILAKEITCFELEYPCHSDSENRWFIFNIKEIGSYTPRQFLCTHKDISNLVLRETRVLEAQRLEAVGQLSAGIAHDFNNLLAVLMGNIEIAKLKTTNGDIIDEYLKNSLTAINRGASLVQKLLVFARKQDLKLECINVNTFIKNSSDLMQALLGEDINISTKLNDALLAIEVDGSLLNNALLNIAINAKHAMPSGGELTIRTSEEELNNASLISTHKKVSGSYVVISITDSGTGIEKETINKVFEPFFTTKEVGQGSGLGLSMVYGFMKQSNGHIHIISRIGKGTTICLYFPLANKNSIEDKIKPNSSLKLLGEKTILLVEHNEEFLDTINTMLMNIGYQVIACKDGNIALATLKDCSGKIDIVLTDIMMPNSINGIELAKEIKRTYPNIKTLLMSGYPNEDYKDIDSTLSPSILVKPFSLEELSEAINKTQDH